MWSEGESPIPLSGPGTADRLAETSRANGDGTRTASPHRQGHRSPSAGDFSAERMLRPEAELPTRGWRLGIYRLTGGLIDIGPSTGEVRHRELIARAKIPLHG